HSFAPHPSLNDCQPFPPRYLPAPPDPGKISLPIKISGSRISQISMSPISPSGFHKAAERLIPSFTALAPTPHAADSKLFNADKLPWWSIPPPCNQLDVCAFPALISSKNPRPQYPRLNPRHSGVHPATSPCHVLECAERMSSGWNQDPNGIPKLLA